MEQLGTQTNRYRIFYTNAAMVLLCGISAFVFLFCNENPLYSWMYLLPVAFCISFVFVFSKQLFQNPSIFLVSYVSVAFVRYVCYPALFVITKYYPTRSPIEPSLESYHTAFLLMVYELLAAAFLFWILERRRLKKLEKWPQADRRTVFLPTHYTVYFLFILFALGMAVLVPRALRSFNFLIPRTNLDTELYLSQSLLNFVIICLNTAKQLVFLIILGFCYRRYQIAGKRIWMYPALCALALNIIIYPGVNRSDFVMVAIASCIIYVKLFPSSKKWVGVFGTAVMLILLPIITNSRSMSWIGESGGYLQDMTGYIQSYLAGPYNVAIAVETALMYPEGRTFANLLFDFARPTLGLNMLTKNLNLQMSTYYFNMRMHPTRNATQIIPMIGQGYYFLGGILAPLLDLAFVHIGTGFTNVIRKANRIEIIYFFAITCARLGFAMGQNAAIQMNDLSFNLLIPVILYWLNNRFVLRKSENGSGQ